mmetsp:Transcript_29535/g.57976  ORF Transcript_29535/g.57976 Transcript_29535/m.57976 type:complete len:250 (-) Transcript_29535:477-1226(-)
MTWTTARQMPNVLAESGAAAAAVTEDTRGTGRTSCPRKTGEHPCSHRRTGAVLWALLRHRTGGALQTSLVSGDHPRHILQHTRGGTQSAPCPDPCPSHLGQCLLDSSRSGQCHHPMGKCVLSTVGTWPWGHRMVGEVPLACSDHHTVTGAPLVTVACQASLLSTAPSKVSPTPNQRRPCLDLNPRVRLPAVQPPGRVLVARMQRRAVYLLRCKVHPAMRVPQQELRGLTTMRILCRRSRLWPSDFAVSV